MQRAVCEQSGAEAVTPNKRLNPERLAKLEAIGFAWTAKNVKKAKSPTSTPPNAPAKITKKTLSMENMTNKAAARNTWHDELWEEYYNRLRLYKEKYGDCLVPRKFDQDPKLATWVELQRALWNRDIKQQLNPKAQDAIHPESPEGSEDMQAGSSQGAQGLLEPVSPEGCSPGDRDQKSISIDAQSRPSSATDALLLDSETGKMPAKRLTRERYKKLDELGLCRSLRHKRIEAHWDGMFQELLAYKKAHGGKCRQNSI